MNTFYIHKKPFYKVRKSSKKRTFKCLRMHCATQALEF